MNKESLISSLTLKNINLDEVIINKLLFFKDDTIKTNEVFNLTAIKDDEEFIEKMIYDSLIGLSYIEGDNKKCIDVGTGGGFPGMVLAIANSDNEYTLLDATKKKIDRLIEYSKNNDINNVLGVNDRSELFAKNNREKYDYAFARAVAPLSILLEIITPMLKVGGTFICYKGKKGLEELKQATSAIKKLDLKVKATHFEVLPESKEERYILEITKINKTNRKYPRDYSLINSKPL